MPYYVYFIANGVGYCKFGDVRENSNYEARLKKYRTHNPLINEENFVILSFHSNSIKNNKGNLLKQALIDKGAEIVQGTKEWLRCTNSVFVLKVLEKIKSIQKKSNYSYFSLTDFDDLVRYLK